METDTMKRTTVRLRTARPRKPPVGVAGRSPRPKMLRSRNVPPRRPKGVPRRPNLSRSQSPSPSPSPSRNPSRRSPRRRARASAVPRLRLL